jgi:tripartite-type tricarboxylate transporter receptor subunit TctC
MEMGITRRALSLGLGLAPLGARAQGNWPSGPVRLVVGFPPGGGNDLLARILAEGLAAAFGQPFIVENRPGGSGVIAIEAVRRAAPDGQTLLIGPSSGMTVNPVLLPNVTYDPLRDFEAIGIIGSFPLLVVVNPSNPARDLAGLIAQAKARPGQVTYASAASSFQIATEIFAAAAGVSLLHVPYRGSAPAVQAVLSNEVTLTFGDVAAVLPLIGAGQLRALAISTPQRSPALPDVPTVAEAGVPGYGLALWSALFAPRGTPGAVTARLQAELARLAAQPAFRERLRALGVEAVGSTGEELAATIRTELEAFGAIVRRAGITVQN